MASLRGSTGLFQPGRKKILIFRVILGTLGLRRLQNAQTSLKIAFMDRFKVF
jgi:hypothetical protein